MPNNAAPFHLGDAETMEAFRPPQQEQEPIDLLRPDSDHHKYVLEYLLTRIKASEDRMTDFYPRWQIAERKMQAYLSLPNYEQMLKDMNDRSKPPAPAIILFPYKYAVISTIVTYCMKVFCGRKPFFPLGADSREAADNVRYMEAMVQHHLDKTKAVMRIFQLLLDGELYGVAAIRCAWKETRGRRRVLRPPAPTESMLFNGQPGAVPGLVKDYEDRVIWSGNDLMNIDPYMFFPDPNVPMCEVSAKGEYVFWREFIGKHILIAGQQAGKLKYVDKVEPLAGNEHDSRWYNLSHRSILTGGQSHAGDKFHKGHSGVNNTYMVDQGSVEIIPAELGLGPEQTPRKFIFTILNKKQIVQCQPLDFDHGRHPVEVSEPYSLGYGFGQPALGDYIGPIQDILSWFLDSHIYNVRAALNNQWVYDPSKIDENSLKYPQPGKNIRLKPLAYGTDVRTAIQQLPVTDATRNHINDLSTFIRIGDMVSSVNDPMRGVQPQGGRRTATETRAVGEKASDRLSVHSQLISEQCLRHLTEQMVLNIQQLQDSDVWLQVIGQDSFKQVGAQLLTGDFTYPIHDGTLPLDRVASFDLWKEILTGMAQSPLLMQTHSLPRIFENVCQLGGANNIASFRLVDDATMDQMVRQGNAISLPQAAGAMPNGAIQ